MAQCVHRKKTGEQCGAHALIDADDRCWFHSKSTEAVKQRTNARRKGGRIVHRPYSHLVRGKSVRLKSVRDILRFLSTVIEQVRSGKMETRKGTALAYLCNVACICARADGGRAVAVEFNLVQPSGEIPKDADLERHQAAQLAEEQKARLLKGKVMSLDVTRSN